MTEEQEIMRALFDDAFYNWALANGIDIYVKGSDMNSSFHKTPKFLAEIDLNKLKIGISELLAAPSPQLESK